MIVVICYFLKSIKSVFILVRCNTSLSNNYVARSVSVVCVIGWIWEKNRFVCTFWLSLYMKSVVDQAFLHKFAFDNKVLKTFVKFRIWWKRSKFKCCRILSLSNSYSNIVTSILEAASVLREMAYQHHWLMLSADARCSLMTLWFLTL